MRLFSCRSRLRVRVRVRVLRVCAALSHLSNGLSVEVDKDDPCTACRARRAKAAQRVDEGRHVVLHVHLQLAFAHCVPRATLHHDDGAGGGGGQHEGGGEGA